MKVFMDHAVALKSFHQKDTFYLNGKCPYIPEVDALCGNWCALFYLSKATENLSAHVILGCKAGEKLLYVEDIVY